MIRVFGTMDEYVEFLTKLPIENGEAFCLSFLPSALFPKDLVHIFFERIEPSANPNNIASQLWFYGKQVMRAVEKGKVKFCIDVKALNNLCTKGQVHEASPKYEVSFAVRVQVLRNLRRMARSNGISITRGPIPYVFRLHPPSGILLDVKDNVIEQRVQGLWIEDNKAFKAFENEFLRLANAAPPSGQGSDLVSELDNAIGHLSLGDPYHWSWS